MLLSNRCLAVALCLDDRGFLVNGQKHGFLMHKDEATIMENHDTAESSNSWLILRMREPWMEAPDFQKGEVKLRDPEDCTGSVARQILGHVYSRAQEGFALSKEEAEKMHDIGGAATYGEATYTGWRTLIQNIDGGVTDADVIYDLGAGTGKIALATALITEAKGVGVEFSPTRYGISTSAKNSLLELVKKLNVETCYPSLDARVSLIQGDIAVQEYAPATIAFMNSTCFSPDLIDKVCGQLLATASRLRYLISNKLLPTAGSCGQGFDLLKTVEFEVTWMQTSTAFYYLTSSVNANSVTEDDT